MAAFGRETWERHGEAFAVLFGFFARIGPLFARDGRIRVRWPLTGLAGADRIPGTLAFVAVMLGSVLFDGYSRTTTWQDLAARVEGPFIVDRPLVGRAARDARSASAVCSPRVLLVAAAYAAACTAARWAVNAPAACSRATSSSRSCRSRSSTSSRTTSRPSCIQGQFAVPLLSDPLGRGWDLFGTADVVPNLAAVSPTTTWYVQVGALVAGHVAGLAIAHDRAVTIFPDRRIAVALAASPARADGALHGRRAVGALARLIAHHPEGLALALELGVLAILVAGFGGLWLRERRRRLDRTRRVPEMRE